MRGSGERECPLHAEVPLFQQSQNPHSSPKIGLEWGTRRPSVTSVPRRRSAFEQVPGFQEFGVARVFAVGGEPDVEGTAEGSERQDVPGVGGNDVGGDEIDLGGGVGAAAVADRTNVRLQPLLAGAFDLDAEEASVVLDGEVVGSVFAPGLGDAESEFGGAGHEAQFGPLSARLRLADPHTWIFHIY